MLSWPNLEHSKQLTNECMLGLNILTSTEGIYLENYLKQQLNSGEFEYIKQNLQAQEIYKDFCSVRNQ